MCSAFPEDEAEEGPQYLPCQSVKQLVARPSHLLYVLNTFNDVAAFHRLLDGVGVAQDPQVLLQRLLDQTGG